MPKHTTATTNIGSYTGDLVVTGDVEETVYGIDPTYIGPEQTASLSYATCISVFPFTVPKVFGIFVIDNSVSPPDGSDTLLVNLPDNDTKGLNMCVRFVLRFPACGSTVTIQTSRGAYNLGPTLSSRLTLVSYMYDTSNNLTGHPEWRVISSDDGLDASPFPTSPSTILSGLPSNPASVVLSSDGSTMAVTALDYSKILIYTRPSVFSNMDWSLSATVANPLTATRPDLVMSSQFGYSVALSDSGDYMIVGMPGIVVSSAITGTALMYMRDVTTGRYYIVFQVPGEVSRSGMGHSVAIAGDGCCFAVGEPNGKVVSTSLTPPGVVHFYEIASSTLYSISRVIDSQASIIATILNPPPFPMSTINEWHLVPYGVESDLAGGYFGHRIAIAGNGSRVVVSSPNLSHTQPNATSSGALWVYDFSSDMTTPWKIMWSNVGRTTVGRVGFGQELAISADGTSIISTTQDGGVYRVTQDYVSGDWVTSEIVPAPWMITQAPSTSPSVALSADGTVCAVTHAAENKILIYIRNKSSNRFEVTKGTTYAIGSLQSPSQVSLSGDGSLALSFSLANGSVTSLT